MIRNELLKMMIEYLEDYYESGNDYLDDCIVIVEDWQNIYCDDFVALFGLNEREIEFLEFNWSYIIMMFCNYMKLKEVNMWYYN